MSNLPQIVGLLLGCLGMASNGLLMVVLGQTRSGWKRLNLQIVVPISLIDFSAAFLVTIKNILVLSMGNDSLFSSPWFCPYFGTSLLILPCLSMVLISTMAVDRYCLVVHGFGIRCLFGWLFIALIGGMTASLLIANTAINGLVTKWPFTYCRPDGPTGLTFAAHRIATAIILLGFSTVSFCYISIYLHCRIRLAKFQTMPSRFLLILVLYYICWLPKFITSAWGLFSSQKYMPKFLLYAGPLGLTLLFAINPLLVIGFQYSLRKKVYSMLAFSPSTIPDNASFHSQSSDSIT